MEPQPQMKTVAKADERGFSLVEFLISAVVLLVVSASVFSMLAETQRAASYQTEVQTVLENMRLAMDTLERVIRQAGNNPTKAAFQGVTVVTALTEINFSADITGSAAGQPDKGDPDGDILDAGENVTIQYDSTNRTINLVAGASSQPIASYIGAFEMRCYDANNVETISGPNVRKVRVTITGASTLPNPQNGHIFTMRQTSDIELVARI
jgi:prepilin-type N-terminal cleavage/methylation domain-containing protein